MRDNIMLALQDDPPPAVRASDQQITDLEPGRLERVDRESDLVLGTDTSCPSTSDLYFLDICKDISARGESQGPFESLVSNSGQLCADADSTTTCVLVVFHEAEVHW